MARITITDVARMAGVSKATVSRVMNGNYGYIKDETREKVLDAIQKLEYRPSSVARSLASNRTQTTGILVSDVGNPFYANVIHGVEDVAFEHGYDLFLCNTNYDEERGLAIVQSLIDKRVDGVFIMSSSMSNDWIRELNKNSIPSVILDWQVTMEAPCVAEIQIDYEVGIKQAVEHLIELGHQRFAHISGPLSLETARDRKDAFVYHLAENGIDKDQIVIVEGDLKIEGGRKALPEILASPIKPTAIFTANDMTAMGVIGASRRANIRIPEDISLVGLDDTWLAAQMDPPLTTVALPNYYIGKLAMETLLKILERSKDNSEQIKEVVSTELVIRETTERQE
ncbi:MAG: LacI family transcriptional regulator [Chloroflexi bacterium]|nr:LacI family transcriptional regulator [Chloroflexota bacterium]